MELLEQHKREVQVRVGWGGWGWGGVPGYRCAVAVWPIVNSGPCWWEAQCLLAATPGRAACLLCLVGNTGWCNHLLERARRPSTVTSRRRS